METIGGTARKYICRPTQAHTDAGRHTKACTEVMGLQYWWSAKAETLKCHLCSWDAIYSHTQTHAPTREYRHLCSLYYVMLSLQSGCYESRKLPAERNNES